MAADYRNIETPNWSLNLATEGEVLTDIQDIAQCMGLIFNTRTGSDPLRPDFGTEIWRWIDKPVNTAIPAIRTEIIRGVERWEPRAEITRIVPNLNVSDLTFDVYWRAIVTGETAITNFNLQLGTTSTTSTTAA
jgi:phage baseplate assembly protein W